MTSSEPPTTPAPKRGVTKQKRPSPFRLGTSLPVTVGTRDGIAWRSCTQAQYDASDRFLDRADASRNIGRGCADYTCMTALRHRVSRMTASALVGVVCTIVGLSGVTLPAPAGAVVNDATPKVVLPHHNTF